MYYNNDVKRTNETMLHNLWDIIDELRKENNELKLDHQEYGDFISKIDKLERELNIREDAIVDLNECIDDLKQENKQFKEEISLLRGEISLDDCEEGIKLKQENKELENNLKIKENELFEEWKENNNLRTKLNETISCKDYEGEASEYFHHNPKHDKVSFYMFNNDDIDHYGLEESMEICTIYNEDLKEYRR